MGGSVEILADEGRRAMTDVGVRIGQLSLVLAVLVILFDLFRKRRRR
jgi:hypothetical protein